jgi:hypothetical protein
MRLMLRTTARTKLFNNDGQLFAVRQLTSDTEDSFVWKLLGIKPTFREVWISETWLMRRAMQDVLLRSPSGFSRVCRTCPIYFYYKNMFDPLRDIKKRLWRVRYKSIDDRRRKKVS